MNLNQLLSPAATRTGYGMKEIQRLGKNLHTTLALACRVPDLKEYGDGRRT
jgi:hypothetical protein